MTEQISNCEIFICTLLINIAFRCNLVLSSKEVFPISWHNMCSSIVFVPNEICRAAALFIFVKKDICCAAVP